MLVYVAMSAKRNLYLYMEYNMVSCNIQRIIITNHMVYYFSQDTS